MEEMLFEGVFISVALETFFASFVGNFPRNNPIKFGWNPPSCYWDVIWIFPLCCSGLHFAQWSRTIWAILVEDLPRNNPNKFCWNLPGSYGGVVWSVCFFSIFSSGHHFVQLRGTVWAILVEDLPKNYPIKFGWNLPSGYWRDVVWRFFFLFLALATILCSGAERFEQFW